ncbi:HNH endonuclease [Acinetobacter variabilis]|uniref:HNH endonuclease n=1 Tax=Acinetobacter variabilis TaxID=70346 RepID=UPI0021D13292|nr:HNH endonuclease [Acinetobacter variabilis]MCU4630540.1 HNH endonuclease [Acinetobacter variabilis]
MTADNSARFAIPSKSFISCIICATNFTPRRKTQVCCSPKCNDKHRYQLNKQPKLSNCIHCNSEYTVKQGQAKYCSSECRNLHISQNTKADRIKYTEIAKAHVRVTFCVICHAFCEAPYAGGLKKYCSSGCENKARPSVVEIHCSYCKMPHVKTGNGSWVYNLKYCSIQCRDDARARVTQEKLALRRIAENNKPKPVVDVYLFNEIKAIKQIAKKAKTSKTCLHCLRIVYTKHAVLHPTCRKEYTRIKREQYKQTDSYKQNRKAAKSKRKALERGAKVAEKINPDFILERDKYRCYICGIKTPKKLRGTCEDNAPEVDHIIPLSKGGLHVESNLRCACRKCNGLKSDRVYQLI